MIERVFALAELHETLHELAASFYENGESPVKHLADEGVGTRREPEDGVCDLSQATDAITAQQLAALANLIWQLLPWRSVTTAVPVAMDVIGAGLLEQHHYLYPTG